MSFETSISPDGDYVICRVTEPITAELARKFGKATDELSRAEGIRNRLFDVRSAPNVESVAGNYDFAYKDMADLEISRNARTAILTAPGDESHDFVETAARNAGYNIRAFTSEPDAVAWLTGTPTE